MPSDESICTAWVLLIWNYYALLSRPNWAAGVPPAEPELMSLDVVRAAAAAAVGSAAAPGGGPASPAGGIGHIMHTQVGASLSFCAQAIISYRRPEGQEDSRERVFLFHDLVVYPNVTVSIGGPALPTGSKGHPGHAGAMKYTTRQVCSWAYLALWMFA